MKLEFDVVQYPKDDGYYWKAIDRSNKEEIDFTKTGDGMADMHGEYPAIEKYVNNKYKLDIPLSNKKVGNLPNIDNEKKTLTWSFVDTNNNEVIIYDIIRSYASSEALI